MGFRSYIRHFWGAISEIFRHSLPWGFAAGSGSLLGFAASHQQQQQQQVSYIPIVLIDIPIYPTTYLQISSFYCFPNIPMLGSQNLAAVQTLRLLHRSYLATKRWSPSTWELMAAAEHLASTTPVAKTYPHSSAVPEICVYIYIMIYIYIYIYI